VGAEIAKLADAAAANFNKDDPTASVLALLAIRAKLAALKGDTVVLAEKRAQLDRILQACLGLVVETTVPNAEAVPGETLALHHTASVKGKMPVRWKSVQFRAGTLNAGARAMDIVSTANYGDEIAAGQSAAHDSKNPLPASTPVSQPYWL